MNSIIDARPQLASAAVIDAWKTLDGARPRIIAHRGASGYRPEHTLDAYALAIEQGADVVEPDVVASRDGVLFVRHDLGLRRSTDIAARPEVAARARELGGVRDWWIEDFDACEVETLRAVQPAPGRDLRHDGRWPVPRLAQLLDLAIELGTRRGTPVMVEIEFKEPGHFIARGIDVLGALQRDLGARGLLGAQAPVWLESADHAFLRSASADCGNRCVALFETLPEDAHERGEVLREVAAWSAAIAPAKQLLWDERGADSGLVRAAHALGLQVHAWTFRDDASPASFASARAELDAAFALGVDALFCDFVDAAIAARSAFRPPDW